MNERLARLFEAHVQHELANWRGDAVARVLEARVNALFRWFGEVKLDDVMTRERVAGVIERYVINLRVSGGITELSGEMSKLVLTSPASARTRLDEVLTQEMYAEFADKILALEAARRELISLIARSSTISAIGLRLLGGELRDLVALALPIPNDVVRTLAAKLGARVLPGLERRAADALSKYRERMVRAAERNLLDVLDAERLRSLVDELWDPIATLRLSEVFGFVGEQDMEDFVVLVYEFWLRYRKTAFFREISNELIEYFFEKYGQDTLLALIEEMGVTEDMVATEVVELFRPIIEQAVQSGAWERQLRERLREFYTSAAAASALAE